MVKVHCDICGKVLVPEDDNPIPNIRTFTTFEFCTDCFDKVEQEWAKAFQECGHDMSVFKKKQVEVASNMVNPPTSKPAKATAGKSAAKKKK